MMRKEMKISEVPGGEENDIIETFKRDDIRCQK